VYQRKEYPFQGRTVSVRKSQAKACVRKSDSRLAPQQVIFLPLWELMDNEYRSLHKIFSFDKMDY
jgi:hypothetical protein